MYAIRPLGMARVHRMSSGVDKNGKGTDDWPQISPEARTGQAEGEYSGSGQTDQKPPPPPAYGKFGRLSGRCSMRLVDNVIFRTWKNLAGVCFTGHSQERFIHTGQSCRCFPSGDNTASLHRIQIWIQGTHAARDGRVARKGASVAGTEM